MSNEITVNLVETTTFTQTIKCQLPGEGVDTWRDLSFKATFKPMGQEDWEDLIADAMKSEALREVLVGVDGIPGATLPDGTALTPIDVVIRNPFTCDALFGHYAMFISRNGRSAAKSAEGKNFKRSRSR